MFSAVLGRQESRLTCLPPADAVKSEKGTPSPLSQQQAKAARLLLLLRPSLLEKLKQAVRESGALARH
jgi:hypothetical protein